MSDKIDKKEILKLKNVYHTYKQDSQKVKVLNNVSLEVFVCLFNAHYFTRISGIFDLRWKEERKVVAITQ